MESSATTEAFVTLAESNRIATWIPDSATFYADTANAYRVSYLYHDDGSRGLEWPSPTFWWPDWRKYYLDGLGRLALIARYEDNYIYDKVNGGYQRAGLYITLVTDTVPSCKYDPLGRLIDPCGSSPDRFTYDGDNIVRTGEDDDQYAWTFIHGPGIDDPIMAHRKQSASDHLYIYYVTDGNGRQLAVGDSVGHDYANPDETDPTAAGSDADEYLSNGGKYAGGMHDSFGFQPERHPSTTAPDLSFFRNRWFDQKTGRWTQEDPLGAAAGTNLYNYAGNNPTLYTDPFGLCPRWLTGRPCRNVIGGATMKLRASSWNPDVGRFGMVRDGGTRPHQGVDIIASAGTPVSAADAGIVVHAKETGAHGNQVIIGHFDSSGTIASYTAYSHLTTISVSNGDVISSGQAVGAAGRTGYEDQEGTPTHLHFEIRTAVYPPGGLRGRIDPEPELFP